jgi:hypothetical protein
MQAAAQLVPPAGQIVVMLDQQPTHRDVISGRTGASDAARRAATATERASFGSLLADWAVLSTRTRDANVDGTLSTVSPAATSCCDNR